MNISEPNKKELNTVIDRLIESIKKQQQIEANVDSTDLLDNLNKIHNKINDNIQKVKKKKKKLYYIMLIFVYL